MKFTTIWTMPGMSLGEKFRRTRDWAAMIIASSLPLRIRYWVTIQEVGHAARNSPNVPATPLEEILRELERPKVVT